MKNLPKRSDSIYKKIEEFEDYELTYCVADEMMIRNEKFKEDLKKLNEFRKKIGNRKENKKFEDSIKKYTKFNAYMEKKYFYSEEKKATIKKGYSVAYKSTLFNVYCTQDKMLVEDKEGILEGEKIDRNILKLISNYTKIITFKNPTIRTRENEKTYLNIDLNLSKKRILEYVSMVKDDYDNKENSILKTPSELLETSKNHNKEIAKKEKWADMFFIYDYWKYKKKQNQKDKDIFIDIELNRETKYKEETIRKIRDTMRYYIDDLHYKDLLQNSYQI